jgi:N-acetylglucosaminyldiphosphoundecaprenol N-acetyl-beta-D-mannosaminyltransferase
MSFKCLNVKIDNLSRVEILDRVESADNLQIATVNPEFILEAQKNEEFKNILNSNKTLCVADGIGLKFAAWRYGKNLKHRFAGADLMLEVLKIANENKQRVLIVTHKDSLSSREEIQISLEKLYPNLKVKTVVMQRSSLCKAERGESECKHFRNQEMLTFAELNSEIINYDVVLCNFGAPNQEKFLYQLGGMEGRDLSSAELNEVKMNEEVESLPNLKLAMGIGGSLDFLTGKIKRAPKWMRGIGLEWLYRLMLEPRYRLKRIYNATIVFPIKVMFKK